MRTLWNNSHRNIAINLVGKVIVIRMYFKEFLMKKSELIHLINESLNNVIGHEANTRRNWDEDYLTRSWIAKLIEVLSGQTLDTYRGVSHIKWDAFKLTGTVEHLHGDIAVIVRFIYDKNKMLDGIGFVEAKKRYIDNGKWTAIDTNQIDDELDSSKHPIMLFYDYEETLFHLDNSSKNYNELRNVQAYSMPLDLVDHIELNKNTIVRFAMPFAYQLVNRFFSGYDLEFDNGIIADIDEFLIKKGITKNLVCITIADTKSLLGNSIEINSELYVHVLSNELLSRSERNEEM